MDDILDGLPGVVSIADDIVVHESTPQEHSQRLMSLLVRAREKGLVFNPAKCAIAESEIQFFGNTYSNGGVRPDPAKVEAIAQLKAPNFHEGFAVVSGLGNSHCSIHPTFE